MSLRRRLRISAKWNFAKNRRRSKMKFGNEGTAQSAHSQRKFAHEVRMTILNTIGGFLHKMIIRMANTLSAFKLPQKLSDLPTLFGGHCLDFIYDLSCRH